jgi:hypothetical protein
MFWRLIILLIKPTAYVALYGLISRVGESTGFELSLIAPAASGVSQVTGFSYEYSAVVVLGMIAYALLQTLSATGAFVAASMRP